MGAGGTPDFQYSRIFIDPPGTVNVCLGSFADLVTFHRVVGFVPMADIQAGND
jgi:hypothetical protein